MGGGWCHQGAAFVDDDERAKWKRMTTKARNELEAGEGGGGDGDEGEARADADAPRAKRRRACTTGPLP